MAGEHILVPSMEHATTELFKSLGGQKINEPGHPSRQPGYLSETRGFPSPPCDGFGFILRNIKQISNYLPKVNKEMKLFKVFLNIFKIRDYADSLAISWFFVPLSLGKIPQSFCS